ncbi:MAG TPA: DUF5939 domain-containing protein [Blastocatellia bacterium]|nr:DUF5939 domain-containing protein [Blastocatellia bacterium]
MTGGVLDNSALESKLESLKALGTSAASIERWRDFISNAPADQLFRTNAFELAAKWGVDYRQVLTDLIHATTIGLMELNWDVICPGCAFINEHDHLETVKAEQTCGNCNGTFEVTFDHTVEVTFSVHPGIRPIAPHEIPQFKTNTGRVVTGLDCATLPAFREFFDTHVLSTTESLKVSNVAILFTDIKGSTQLYEKLGDARAYQAVHRHFEVLFKNVSENEGALIKTIGDAVMASFTQPIQAVRAALEAQQSFAEFRPLMPDVEDMISVKMGIHHGPCLAVTLNDQIDFFGRTVNIAARTQQQAIGGELLLTEATYSDPAVNKLLADKGITAIGLQAKLRGLSETFVLYKIEGADTKGMIFATS